METFRHRNGGGRIIGADGAVSSDSSVDQDSLIEGASFISYGSVINHSAVKDSDVSFGNISQSALVHSHVAGAIVSDSGLEYAVIRGTKIRTAIVRNCLLGREVVVEGCSVRGFELSGPHLIHADFDRAPRSFVLEPTPGDRMAITECVNGRFHCGCECRTYGHWVAKKETLRKLFARRGWADDSVDVIHSLFDEWRRVRMAA
jgi:hypothetical protein